MEKEKSFAEKIYEILEIEDDKIKVGDIIITIDMSEYHELAPFYRGYSMERYINMMLEKLQKRIGPVLTEEGKNNLIRKVIRKIFFDILTSNYGWDKQFKIFYNRQKNEIKIPLLPRVNGDTLAELYKLGEDEYGKKEEFIESIISDLYENHLEYIEDFCEKLLEKGLMFPIQDQRYLTRCNRVLDKYLEAIEVKKQAM